MYLPKDPVMLLSFINTQLRDNYSSLDTLAAAANVDVAYINSKLNTLNYYYDRTLNQYK